MNGKTISDSFILSNLMKFRFVFTIFWYLRKITLKDLRHLIFLNALHKSFKQDFSHKLNIKIILSQSSLLLGIKLKTINHSWRPASCNSFQSSWCALSHCRDLVKIFISSYKGVLLGFYAILDMLLIQRTFQTDERKSKAQNPYIWEILQKGLSRWLKWSWLNWSLSFFMNCAMNKFFACWVKIKFCKE